MLSRQKLWQKRRFDDLYRLYPDPWGCKANVESAENEILLAMMKKYKFETILDVGCGCGALTEKIAKKTKAHVVGIDCEEAIKNAKGKAKYQVGNIINYPTSEKYDCVIMSEVLWYIAENFEKVIEKIKQILSTNGYLVIKQYFPLKQNLYREYIDGMGGLMDKMLDWDILQYYMSAETLIVIFKRRKK